MAHYLPVLLVSVSTNAALISDDSHLETQPRGQVDYLSHDWAEEDVWKSWRNMTKQKNEIANGMRLENASWRTWWKQRNKLKTISPETLNWLKDSDVTWLYGPLHTAVDWTPPPKPKPDPSSVDDKDPSSAHDRLDLSSTIRQRLQKHKPILKHRSISEQLTSDYPSSVFSHTRGSDENMSEITEEPEPLEDQNMAQESAQKRPLLPHHTRSEVNLTRWTASATKQASGKHLDALGLRRESPPRIVASSSRSSDDSATTSSGSVSPSPDPHRQKKQRHITFNTFVEQCIAIDKPSPPTPGLHSLSHSSSTISSMREHGFGAASRTTSHPNLPTSTSKGKAWDGRTSGVRWVGAEDEDDDDDDEDSRRSASPGSSSSDEAPFEPSSPYTQTRPWADQPSPYVQQQQRAAQSSSSDDDAYEDVWEDTTTSGSESNSVDREDDDEEDEDDEGIIEMRTSRQATGNRRRNSSSSGGPPPKVQKPAKGGVLKERRRRRSSGGTIVPPPSGSGAMKRSPSVADFQEGIPHRQHHPTRGSTPKLSPQLAPSPSTHITIAPIPPTTLKVGWDGFGVTPHNYNPYMDSVWMEGFGDDYMSDNEYANTGKWYGANGAKTDTRPNGVPTNGGGGLVYVPRYTNATPTSGLEEDDGDNERVWHHEQAYFSTEDSNTVVSKPKMIPKRSSSSSVPIVVRTPPVVGFQEDAEDKDAYDYFAGPDLGEDFGEAANMRRGSYDIRKSRPINGSSSLRSEASGSQRGEPERGRSRSRSRTPSPAVAGVSSPPGSAGISSPIMASSPPFRSPSSPPRASVSPTNSLLSPPTRGRSAVLQHPYESSSSSSFSSSRERSSRDRSSHTSPIGSLSPDGSGGTYNKYGYGAAYANGRSDQKEKEREESDIGEISAGRRDGERGRVRTERRLNHSLSPDAVSGVTSSATDAEIADNSSSSASLTVRESSSPVNIPDSGKTREEEEAQRSLHPTPANSPVAAVKLNSRPTAPAKVASPTSPRNRMTSPTPGHKKDSSIGSLKEDGTIVGRAVGIVNTAGAYLGLWHNSGGGGV